jgi:hypothetical protein
MPFAGGGQAALGDGILVQLLLQGLGGQQLLVDHLVQALAEQIRADVQRLALADQALGDGLALDVRGPDRVAVDPGDGGVARLRRTLVGLVATAGGDQQAEDQDGRKAMNARAYQYSSVADLRLKLIERSSAV